MLQARIKYCLLVVFGLSSVLTAPSPPPVSDNVSFVVSSTEQPKEAATEDAVPSVPKIYDMRVETNVTNRFAKTMVISKVKNLAKSAQEATFSVVLPETAYISGFVMEIDGKNYQAYVKEKEEAKQIYDQAVQQGQAAAHVEANARDSNRFTVSVNVEPQSKATFKLTYEELLQRRSELYEVVLNIHPGQPVKNLNVEVRINETRPLKFVKSPPLRSGNEIGKKDEKLESLAVIETTSPSSAVIKFSPDVERQKQLASGLGTKEENGLAGQFLVQYDVERDPQGGEVLVKDGYFVHFFAPSDLPSLPKQVIFVLDSSGSMDGIRMQQLKQAMNSILAELNKEDIFNIVEFASVVKVWNVDKVEVDYQLGTDPWASYNREGTTTVKPEQVLPPAYEASEANIEKAKKVVEKLTANGGTDIMSGLEVALKLVKKNKDENDAKHQPIIVFLTDGEPTVGETSVEKIISKIREINSGSIRSPIFSLSFGDGADREFLQKISLKNLGFARHIYEAADASLQLQEFYKEISSPLLSNVQFKYVSNITKLTKTVFPIFFHGSELVVAGKLGEDEVFEPPVIKGWGVHGPIDFIPKLERPIEGLERHWAYLTVKQILEARDAAENKTLYTKKALDIALKYSFVTPVSSLVVVKPNATKAVDTEDASKSGNDRAFYLHKSSSPTRFNAFGPPGGGVYASAGISGGAIPLAGTSLQFSAQPINRYPAPIPIFAAAPAPALPEAAEIDSAPEVFFESDTDLSSVPLSITTSLPHLIDEYAELKAALPWLADILAENGTLTITPGYTLGVKEAITKHLDCPKTPVNGTAGTCTLLEACQQVYPLLTNAQIFKDHICFIDKIAGICCPKSVP